MLHENVEASGFVSKIRIGFLCIVSRLLTPPGTPLFPSLEMESQKTVMSQLGTPKARPTVLKSRVRAFHVVLSEIVLVCMVNFCHIKLQLLGA